MKAYKVLTPYNYSQTHIVIADNIGEAEKAFRKDNYEIGKILSIELVADYVTIQGVDRKKEKL